MTQASRTEQICVECGERYARPVTNCPLDGGDLRWLDEEEKRDSRLGKIFAERYKLVGLLGSGGMGSVYHARQLDFEREVAIKILSGRHEVDSEDSLRFLREAETLARLHHPHVVRLFDFGQTDKGRLYMVMELLDGETLGKRLWREGLSYREIFDTMMPICDALSEAHANGIIHRDLKPENISVLSITACNHLFPKLLDFGVAKQSNRDSLTRSGWLCGTPAYMSPEQITGKTIGVAADIYSMGVMLYELVCGTRPFIESSYIRIANAHLVKEPVPLRVRPGLSQVPKQLDELVLSMLAKSPEDRPGSMPELYQRLRTIRDDCFSGETFEVTPAFLRFSASNIQNTPADQSWAAALRTSNGQNQAHAVDSAFVNALEHAASSNSEVSEKFPQWVGTEPSEKIKRIPYTELAQIREAPESLSTSALAAIIGPKAAQARRNPKKKVEKVQERDGKFFQRLLIAIAATAIVLFSVLLALLDMR